MPSGFIKALRNPELSSVVTPNGRAAVETISKTQRVIWRGGNNLGTVEKQGRLWVIVSAPANRGGIVGYKFDTLTFAASALLWDGGKE